jgi:uncharacterized protein (TIGR00299 family) protein
MKLAYFDCPSGISGDMILGALVDCGVSLDHIKTGLSALSIEGYEITAKHVSKNGLAATQIDVEVLDTAKERSLSDILSIVKESQISDKVKEKALGIFERIGSAEARIHGIDVGKIHLHELGGHDTVIDVVGALIGLEILGIEAVYASALPLGAGTIETAHGTIPLPAPATLALLEEAPVHGSEIEKELVTPTGAGILTSIVSEFGKIPAMRLLSTGYGAGKMDLPIPNVLRILIGEALGNGLSKNLLHVEQLVCLDTNIDNMNPEIFSYISERLFEAGARDVTLTPIQMKKNRPGTLISVLCEDENANKIIEILFLETTTLGVRRYVVDRYSVHRQVIELSTPYGNVKVKFSKKGEKSWDYSPEYEDCRQLAIKLCLPIKEIYRAAEEAAFKHVINLG